MSSDQVYFLYGTESGNSEKVASIGCKSAIALGYDAELVDMGQWDIETLEDAHNVFMVIATNGEGEMPLNAEAAWDDAQSNQLTGLSELKFAVLGLGDSSYDYYCQAGHDWDAYFEATGGERIVDCGEADSDFMPESMAWLTEALSAFSGKPEDEVKAVIDAVASGAADDDDDDGWSASNPWHAEILEKRNLCTEQSSKSVRHYALSLKGSDIVYKPGDCIEVLPVNEKPLVEKLIEVMGWTGDEPVTVDGEAYTIRKALKERLEIRQPTLKLLKLLAARGDCSEFKRVVQQSKDVIEEFTYGHDVLSLIEEYTKPPAPKTDFKSRIKALFGKPEFMPRIEARVFVSYLKAVHSRAYSIASSYNANPDEVHLTIADVQYERNGRKYNGAASIYLAERVNVGDKVKCWLLPNKYFVLPEDDNTPLIMVGPGTGIAPFIAFLEEREYRKAQGKNWLFFGDRESANDFLYRDKLEAFQEKGLLTRLDTAFSRDQEEKIYVQHKMKAAGKEIYDWLQEGAIFYVCGDAKYMAQDVEDTLVAILQEYGNQSEEQARKYLKTLQRERRYLKDVY